MQINMTERGSGPITAQQKELLFALKYNRYKEASNLLSQGVNPDFVLPEEDDDFKEEYCNPLCIVIETFDNDQDYKILKELLDHGADPFNPNLPIEYDSIFDWMYKSVGEVDYQCFKLLFEYAQKNNKLDKISLETFSCVIDDEILLTLLENNIHKDAYDCLDSRLTYYSQNGLDLDLYAMPMFYAVIKKLTLLSYPELFGQDEEREINIHQVIELSLLNDDYEFSLRLIQDIQNCPPEIDEIPSIFFLLNKYFLLYQSSQKYVLIFYFLKNMDDNFVAAFNILNKKIKSFKKYEISLNSEALEIANLINTKLSNAITVFLNPFISFCQQLTLELRLKLAKIYLKDELVGYIEYLSDLEIEKILLDKASHYYHTYWPNYIKNIIVKHFKKSSAELDYVISHMIILHPYLFFDPVLRNNLLRVVSNLIFDVKEPNAIYQSIQFFDFLEKSCKDKTQKIIENNNTHYFYTDFIVSYGLSYAIQQKDENILKNIILKLHFSRHNNKELSNFYGFTTNHIQKYSYYFKYNSKKLYWVNNSVLPILCSINSEQAWFNSFLPHCYQNTYKKCIEKSLNLKKYPIMSLLLSACNDFNNLFHILKLFLEKNDERALQLFEEKIKKFHTQIHYSSHDYSYLAVDSLKLIIKNNRFTLLPTFLSIISHAHYAVEAVAIFVSNDLLTTRFMKNPFLAIFSIKIAARLLPEKINGLNEYKNLLKKLKECYPFFSQASLGQLSRLFHALRHYSIIKKPHHFISRFLSKEYITTTKLKELTQLNYNHLISKVDFLTDDEFELYKTFINAQWKLMHWVRKSEDFDKILKEKEIRSIALRKNLKEEINNQNTPANIGSECFVFATIGPKKAPQPHFLKGCSSIEIDINSLLKKHPDFFTQGYVTLHWSALQINQIQNAQDFLGNTCFVYYQNNAQVNEFYDADSKKSVRHIIKLEGGIYNTKRIQHLMTLLFIQRIRLINGKFYQYVLEKRFNIDELCNMFNQVLHSGIVEYRHSGKIALDDSYTNYSYRSEMGLKALSTDTNLLTDFERKLKEGLDPNQSVLILNPCGGICIGNLLTMAILHEKKSAINYLIENFEINYTASKPNFLSPLQAAELIHDSETIVKICSQGYKIKNIEYINYIPYFNSESIFFILLQTKTIYDAIRFMNQPTRLAFFKYLVFQLGNNTFNASDLLQIIKQLLVKEIDIGSLLTVYKTKQTHSRVDQDLLKLTLDKRETLISLLYDSNNLDKLSITIIFEMAIKKNWLNLIQQIINRNSNILLEIMPEINMTYFFLLSISIYHQLFEDALNKVFPNKYCNANEALITFVKDFNSTDQLENFLIYLNNKPPRWTCSKKINVIKEYILTDNSLLQLLYKMQNYPAIKIFFSEKFSTLSEPEFFSFVIAQPFVFKQILTNDFLSEGFFECDNELNNICNIFQNNVQTLFYFMKDYPVEENINSIVSIINTINSSLLDYITRKHITTILVKNPSLIDFFIKILANNSKKIIILNFIIFCLEDERLLKKLLLLEGSIKDQLRSYIKTHLTEFSFELAAKNEFIVGRFNLFIKALLTDPTSYNSLPEFWSRLKPTFFKHLAHTQNFHDPLSATHYNLLKNGLLRKKTATAGIITCPINGKTHVFMGKKKQSNILMAPGGFSKENELAFDGLLRELKEETQYDLHHHLKSVYKLIKDIHSCLENFGSYNFVTESSSIYIPQKITLAYQYSQEASWGLNGIDLFCLDFYILEFSDDISELFSAQDDLTDGLWVPINEIKFDQEQAKYFYQNQEVLASNAILISKLVGYPISYAQLDETIYEERCKRQESKKRLAASMNQLSFIQNFNRTYEQNKLAILYQEAKRQKII